MPSTPSRGHTCLGASPALPLFRSLTASMAASATAVQIAGCPGHTTGVRLSLAYRWPTCLESAPYTSCIQTACDEMPPSLLVLAANYPHAAHGTYPSTYTVPTLYLHCTPAHSYAALLQGASSVGTYVAKHDGQDWPWIRQPATAVPAHAPRHTCFLGSFFSCLLFFWHACPLPRHQGGDLIHWGGLSLHLRLGPLRPQVPSMLRASLAVDGWPCCMPAGAWPCEGAVAGCMLQPVRGRWRNKQENAA